MCGCWALLCFSTENGLNAIFMLEGSFDPAVVECFTRARIPEGYDIADTGSTVVES